MTYTIRQRDSVTSWDNPESYSKEDAVQKAQALAKRFPDRQIFVLAPGNSGMGCYLNPDGNHALEGQRW